ncbi:DNA polymerase III subunit delta' [Ottowia thiooxydans]|uniref:DNA polymerase III subunit delta' n=1 Tax=Ottowia thiooxydans TaxID=219182 RepID=UPI0003F4B834|nr:DNA polymerase III subunit delta' [Ottowia thiooxydans]
MDLSALAPWISRQVETLLAQRGHAWLLQGPSGLGQLELADALVRTWLCDAPTPQGACGQCVSCHAIDVHTHADLAVLMPETVMIERGWPLSEKAQADIDDKKRKPSREIRVESMRGVIEFAQRTSGRGRGKAVLVYPAERMNQVTANALLKTLEEPPGDVRFVLASDAAHLLLPTIRSRCLTHVMVWPEHAEAMAWLTGNGLSEQDAQTMLHAAGGRPAAALAATTAAASNAKSWKLLPKAMVKGDVGALADVPLPEAIARLQKLCHDVIAMQVGASPRFFAAADLPTRPLAISALTRWWGQLVQSARSADHPLNAGLAAESLVSSAREALNSKN